jgi:erythromycin esterase
MRLRDGIPVVRKVTPDVVHTYSMPVDQQHLVRLHLDSMSTYFYARVLDRTGAVITDASAWCSRGQSPCVVPLLASPGDRVEIRSLAVDLPQLRDEYPPDISYRLRLEVASEKESAAAIGQLSAALAWARASSHPLKSITPGVAVGDLEPLRSILADVRVVGLGEATHGSHELFQLKHRLLEFLVREMGFTVFAMEGDEGATAAINEFVLYGRGTGRAALAAGRMWQWDTEEVLALLIWMRDYNRDTPPDRKVRFAGYDFQVNERGRNDVVSYLRRVDPGRVSTADSVMAPLAEQVEGNEGPSFYARFYRFSPEQKKATRTGINQLFDYVAAQRANFIARTSAAEYDDVLQSVRRMVQFTDTHSRPGYEYTDAESGVATRDRYMAENVMRLLVRGGPLSKVVIWGHNNHIGRAGFTLGHYLRERMGDQYYAFGLAFNEGGFRAMDVWQPAPPYPLKNFTFGPAVQESIDWYLERIGIGNMFLDLRHAPVSGPVAEWLGRKHPFRSVGNGYAPTAFAKSGYEWPAILPRATFDGFFIVERVTASHANVRDPGQ